MNRRDEHHALEVTRELLCGDAESAAQAWYRQFEWQEGCRRSAWFLDTLSAAGATLQEFWFIYERHQIRDLDLSLQLLERFKLRVGRDCPLRVDDLQDEYGASLLIS